MKKSPLLISLSLAFLLALSATTVSAESSDAEKMAELEGQIDGMKENAAEMQTTLSGLSKIKFSGYVQSQFQLSENDGIASMSGGSFPSGVHQRFNIRRGRLKVNYVGGLSQYVLQFDVTQNGVGIKDAYLKTAMPFNKALSLWAGAFDRPFGFEISYSSSVREAPERSRIFQTLFPGERDLGLKLEYAPEKGSLSFLRAKLGVFNGTGLTANENDNNKDIIGRLGVSLPFYEQNMALDAGVSFYSGKVRNLDKYTYTIAGTNSDWMVDSTASNKMSYFDRNYVGIDAEYYGDLPIGGISLRTEFITGDQPSLANSSSFYSTSGSGMGTALYQRKFLGYYVNYIQNIGLYNQLVLKYDAFDPNTAVAGSEIGQAGTHFTPADIQYSTLGIGIVHYLDSNLKVVIYYDMPTNEKVDGAASGSLAPFTEDLKDNVLTCRFQFKF